MVLSDRGETKLKTEASQNEVRLPRAVRERMARIHETLEARKSGTAAVNPPPANTPTPPDDTETDPPTARPEPATDPRENDPAYWRQRFNVTQGMLRTLQEQVRTAAGEKDRELTELREKVRTLEEGKRASDGVDVATFFTPEQIERFGQDQCEAMAATAIKAARQSAQQVIDAEVKPLKEQATARAASAVADKRAAFFEKLAELVPDYDVINADDKWLEWLAEPDESTGLLRQDILDRHNGASNAIAVAKVFQNFKKTQARPTPPVVPSRSAGGGEQESQASNTPALGYPTAEESRAFYKRAKLGKVSEKERAAFEARLKSRAAA